MTRPPRSRGELLTRRAELARRRRAEHRAAMEGPQPWPDNARTLGQLALVRDGQPSAIAPYLVAPAIRLQLANLAHVAAGAPVELAGDQDMVWADIEGWGQRIAAAAAAKRREYAEWRAAMRKASRNLRERF